ncbi:MAG TPA: type II toxin-antitoxin system RelE/ParE family toxin, partial [Blastocatellia bacterium]|nr:type II toxin-antitoxin system RelE/ParE family toxin [Blastocatellia bacterium]
MKRFKVIISPAAEVDIEGSYLWGRKHWGIGQANKWVRELRAEIVKLCTLPERLSLAPESSAFAQPIRQTIVGRYRVL